MDESTKELLLMSTKIMSAEKVGVNNAQLKIPGEVEALVGQSVYWETQSKRLLPNMEWEYGPTRQNIGILESDDKSHLTFGNVIYRFANVPLEKIIEGQHDVIPSYTARVTQCFDPKSIITKMIVLPYNIKDKYEVKREESQ